MLTVTANKWENAYRPLNNLMRIDQSDMSKATGLFMKGMRARIKGRGYPHRRIGQRYQRTGIFANAWKTIKLGGEWHLLNEAEQHGRVYPAYVVGDEFGQRQAWMHAGRWWTFLQVLAEEIYRFESFMRTWMYKMAVLG